jgi:hypothetical protein
MADRSHLSEVEIIRLLAGELSVSGSAGARKHLEQCWQCRTEVERVDSAISAYMDYQSAMLGTLPPLGPGDTDRFLARLRQASFEAAPAQRRPALWKWAWVAAAVAAAAFVVPRMTSVETVSAMEVLNHIQAADSNRAPKNTSLVVHQKLEVRRKKGKTTTHEEVDQWRAAGPARWHGASDLSGILASNHLQNLPLLTGDVYRNWRKGGLQAETVESARGADGQELYTLDGRAPDTVRKDAIVQASLSVRKQDWRPVRERMVVRRDGYLEEFDITELAYEIVPGIPSEESGPTVPPAPIIPTHPPVSTLPPAAERPIAKTTPVASDNVLADVVYALHRIGIHPGGLVEISSQGEQWLLQGVVDSPEQRDRISVALEAWWNSGQVVLDLRTPAESVSKEPPVPTRNLGTGVYHLELPMQRRLAERLAGPGANPAAARELLARAVHASERAALHAAILRRIVSIFDGRHLSRESGWLVEAIYDDHREAIASAIADLKSVTAMAGVPQSRSLPETDGTLSESAGLVSSLAARVDELVGQLFAGNIGREQQETPLLESLREALPALEAALERFHRLSTGAFEPQTESKK